MATSLTNELFWLVLTLLMTSLFWLPYIIDRTISQGILSALWDPYGNTFTKKKWSLRMMRAHENAIENLAIFAPLVILVQITGVNSTTTATACMIYFFARLAHYIIFTVATPVLRILTFLIGFAAQVTLAITLLGI